MKSSKWSKHYAWREKNIEYSREYRKMWMRLRRGSKLEAELPPHKIKRKVNVSPLRGKDYVAPPILKAESVKHHVAGSVNDESWNGKEHTCCNSKVVWRHKVTCQINSDDLSDLKDI